MSQIKVPHLKDAMTEPKSDKHVLKKLTKKVFSRRRTTIDVNKEPTLPSSRTPSSAVQKQQQRSSLLTSSTSSRHHSALHGVNTFIPQPASSLQAESHIPRPKVHRKSRGFIKAASEDLSLNLEGRYPAMTGPKKRNSDAQVNPRPPRASFNTSLPRSNTLNNVITETSSCVPGFMRPTSSSTARSSLRGSPGPSLPAKTETTTRPNQRRTPRSSLPAPTESMTRTDRYRGGASGHRSSVPSFSRPIPSRMKLGHDEDGNATSRQVPAVDITPDSVNQTSHGVMSDVGEGQSSAVAISTTPTANNGDYSFAASEETIGPAFSGPTPLGQDVIYESANEAPEPPEFEMPERLSISSDSHTPQGAELTTETPGSEVKDNILPDMGGKNINPQIVRRRLSFPSPSHIFIGSYHNQKSILFFLYKYRLAPPNQQRIGSAASWLCRTVFVPKPSPLSHPPYLSRRKDSTSTICTMRVNAFAAYLCT